jgi:TRAP-type C4-dicarboxylate transport system permease small subunit
MSVSEVAAASAHGEAAARRSLFDRIDAVLVGGFAAAALLVCAVNVLIRTVAPQSAFDWGDEVQVYLVIWAVCLSFGAVTAANRHVRADLFVELLPPGVRRAAHVLSDLLGFGMSALLTWYGAAVTLDGYEFGDLSTTTLRFPLWIYLLALPVGAGLMTLRYAIRLWRGLFSAGRSGVT